MAPAFPGLPLVVMRTRAVVAGRGRLHLEEIRAQSMTAWLLAMARRARQLVQWPWGVGRSRMRPIPYRLAQVAPNVESSM
ncbi:hypothetical protein D3C81_988040 [compost metagenome]